jgi:SAM-dependent methyltransferase
MVNYLNPGNYYGIDANQSVVEAGYDNELTDEERKRLPVGNLRATDRFRVEFGDTRFDYAIAQSVFTHISLNNIRLCLYRVAKVMKPGGIFFATIFERGPDFPLDGIVKTKGGKPKFQERNCYWYYRHDLRWAAKTAPWEFKYIGDWQHHANQQMIQYTRMPD